MKPGSNLLIKNVQIVDSKSTFNNQRMDVLVNNGVYDRIGKDLQADEHVITLNGDKLTLIPGLFDFQVTCGEPGEEENETFESLSAAALNGGVSGMLVMPSEHPHTENRGQIEFKEKLCKHLPPDFRFAGFISREGKGKTISEMHDMRTGGALAFTDNKLPSDNSLMIHLAIQYNSIAGGLLIFHAEDSGLRMGGSMHESKVSVQLGIKGTPSIAEETAVNKLLALAEYHNHPIHISGVSCKGSINLISKAKKSGIPVTCSAFIQNLHFCDEDLGGFDSVFKVWPPLRGTEDRQALTAAVLDGTIDVLCSDHHALAEEKKELEFAYASYGMAGTETLLQAALSKLGAENLTLITQSMCHAPRTLLGLESYPIAEGGKADFVLLDPAKDVVIKTNELKSKGVNNPFANKTLMGEILGTYTSSGWFSRSV